MDATEPKYSEEKYNQVKEDVTALLKTVGYNMSRVQFIPVSAFVGDNAVKRSEKLKWYKGATILEGMDKFEVSDKPTNIPLRWPIQDVYTITGIGTVPVGRIEAGVMKSGQTLTFQPSDKKGEVKSIEMHHEMIESAEPGDNVGANIRGLSKKDIRRGDVAGTADKPPTVARTFVAQIAVLQHPNVITVGYTPVFHCHTAQVACRFEELQKKLDPKTGQVLEENPQFLKTGDIAIVKIMPTRPMVIERAKDFPQLGRFAIRDMGSTVAAGMCIEVEKREIK